MTSSVTLTGTVAEVPATTTIGGLNAVDVAVKTGLRTIHVRMIGWEARHRAMLAWANKTPFEIVISLGSRTRGFNPNVVHLAQLAHVA